jgi:SAM-dependent methyltransferase
MQAEMYELHNELENSHWWFTARREIVLSLLTAEVEGDAALRPPLRLLDAGSGAGGMVRHLARFGSAIGVDPAPAAVEYAASKGVDVRLGGLPDSMPFDDGERFDVITALDVLEHIDDDAAAVHRLHALLDSAGRLIVTVPAFMFLWSQHDVVNEHHRRYDRKRLAALLQGAGFEILLISYCNAVLFPPIALVRCARSWLRRGASTKTTASGDLGRVPEPINAMLHHTFAGERFLLRRMTLPFGVSLVAVARPATTGRSPA